MKIAINAKFGGFGLSNEAIEYYLKLKGLAYESVPTRFGTDPLDISYYLPSQAAYDAQRVADRQDYDAGDRDNAFAKSAAMYMGSGVAFQRDESALIQTIEALGEQANGRFAKLKIVEIPDGIEWEIDNYDGLEGIQEKHRSWS